MGGISLLLRLALAAPLHERHGFERRLQTNRSRFGDARNRAAASGARGVGSIAQRATSTIAACAVFTCARP
jgi:hypothetical protein